MELKLHNGSGTIAASDVAFGMEFNEALVHQAVVGYMAGARQGTKAQKTRSEVSGGGKKPWNQKGSGRARAGTIRSPLWRGGGNAFAAKPRDHSVQLNKKMYRGAMRSILSELVRQERLVVVEDFALSAPKTKELVAKLSGMDMSDALIVVDEMTDALFLSARNLHKIGVSEATKLNPVSLIAHEKVIITSAALRKVEEWLG